MSNRHHRSQWANSMNTETINTAATNESDAVYFGYWHYFWLSLAAVGVVVPAHVLLSYLLGDDWPSGWDWAWRVFGASVSVIAIGFVVEWRARRKRAARAGVSTSADRPRDSQIGR